MSVILSPLVEESNGTAATPSSTKESSALSSSSPADSSGKKRTRATTRALLNVDGNGSPEKAEKPTESTQPARKVSKVSVTIGSNEHP